MYDLVVIGAGPSGLTAGIYAQRAMLNTIIIEKEPMSGGQVLNTYEVENYPGFSLLNGFDLADKFREHAENLGVKFFTAEVEEIIREKDYYSIKLLGKEPFVTKTIIVATGAKRRKLNVPGEEEFLGHGVSYCATCDGVFFKEKVTAVVGGGDSALESAIYLSRTCKKVYIIHRRDAFLGIKRLQEHVKKLDNIEVLWDTEVKKIKGSNRVESVDIKNTKTGEIRNINLDGIFIAIGSTPLTNILKGLVDMDELGYVIADETGKTSLDGIFVAGDIRKKELRQIITAAADGANCVNSVEKYLEK